MILLLYINSRSSDEEAEEEDHEFLGVFDVFLQ